MSKIGVSLLFLALFVTGCAGPSIEKQGTIYRIAIPSNDWLIEFPAEGFIAREADESRPYLFLRNEKTGVDAIFTFREPEKCSDSKSCRDFFVRKMQMAHADKKEWKIARLGELYTSENMDGLVVGGFDPRTYHLNAHLVKNDLWLDLHIMKMSYDELDREMLYQLLRGMKITDYKKR
jgi:hypothetical protein